jgi:hypothetical protein
VKLPAPLLDLWRDPGVESLRHDVDRRLAHRELEVDFRIVDKKHFQTGATTAA